MTNGLWSELGTKGFYFTVQVDLGGWMDVLTDLVVDGQYIIPYLVHIYRNYIGTVSQEPILFNSSIRVGNKLRMRNKLNCCSLLYASISQQSIQDVNINHDFKIS